MKIWLDNTAYNKQQLAAGAWGNHSAYGQEILRFCQRWLRGEQRFLLQTSGSTGKPKPIELQRQQMQASAHLTGAALGLQPGMRSLMCLNGAYIAGIMMLVRGIELGLETVVVEPTSNPLAAKLPFPIDFTAMVPLQVEAALDDANTRPLFDNIAYLLIGGAPVSQQLVERLDSAETICYHTYGMTETVTHIALRQLNGPQASQRFMPFDGVQLGLDDRACLTIRGPMTLGQLVTTNDRVELMADGSFVWLGRIDNVINSGGVKVQAEKVEQALNKALGHDRIFVAGMAHPTLGEQVVAFVEGDSAEISAEQLPSLSKYEQPKAFYFVETFSETPTGKIDRQAIIAQTQAAINQPSLVLRQTSIDGLDQRVAVLYKKRHQSA